MKYDTIQQATERWVESFNAFPYRMLERVVNSNISEWCELTPITYGCTVWSNEYQDSAEVVEITENEDGEKVVKICLNDNGEEVETSIDDLCREKDADLPMWGTMWSFSDSADDWWIEQEENRQLMADCGFRIYEHEEFGYFFGIDGCGYDFYESHWIPLYKARGLHWHRENPDDGRNYMYEKLKNHIGHNLVCVVYGDAENPTNICIECEDCNEVLISVEKHEDE